MKKKYHGESLKFGIFGMPKKMKSDYIEVRNSKIHGKGVFAKKDIPKKTKIIEYVGEKISKKESQKRAEIQKERSKNSKIGAVYIFDLNKKYDVDGNFNWNTAKYINHSCDPNSESIDEESFIWIVSTRKISKGEEITYNYGYDFDEEDIHPCRCGKENCIGQIISKKAYKKFLRKNEKKGF